ncbi:MAG: YbhB/YbcL family Raf kinase inhibitor-like protein [Terriglobia bacterium]
MRQLLRGAAPRRDSPVTEHFLRMAKIFPIVMLLIVAGSISIAKATAATLELKTTAFHAGGTIPAKFTCSAENASPALFWTQPPPRTTSFVLIVDDPDAPGGTWVHWVVYNLPPSARQLPEHLSAGDSIPGGGKQGVNDFPQTGYGGPCPPPGRPHRYFFRLYALDTTLEVRAPVHRKDLDLAMKGHVLAQAELMGTFGR